MTKFKLPDMTGAKVKPKKFHEAESKVEARLVGNVKAQGGIAYKFTSPQRRSVPDRIVLRDKARAGSALALFLKRGQAVFTVAADELEDIAAGIASEMVRFVELKATGAKPTEGQLREHGNLRSMGFVVEVIDSRAEVDELYPK